MCLRVTSNLYLFEDHLVMASSENSTDVYYSDIILEIFLTF